MKVRNHRHTSVVLFLLTLILGACASPSQSRAREELPRTAQETVEGSYTRMGEDDLGLLKLDIPRKGAIQAFTRAIETEPANPSHYRVRADAALGNYEAALADYSTAIELTPPTELARTSDSHKSLYELRAAVRKGLKDYRGAAEDLTKLIELNPGSFRLYAQRAEIHQLTGDLDAAIGDCRRAVVADPGNAFCSQALAQWRSREERQALASQAPPPERIVGVQEKGPEKKKAEGPPPVVKETKPAVPPSEVKEPTMELSPKVAKPAEARPESPRPAETHLRPEKPAPKPPAEAAKPTGKTKGGYTIQVATLVIEKNAFSLKQRLEKLGYSPVVRKTTARITRHRVTSGEFTSREEAEQAARRLQADGFPSNVIEGEDGKFRPEVGSSFRQDGAIDLARTLEKKNHTAKIVSQPASTPVHQVWVGEYEDHAEALKTLGTLERQGFTPIIVVMGR